MTEEDPRGDREDSVEALKRSRKYRDVAPDALEAALVWARTRADRPRDVVKLAKRKLHQVFGAFLDPEGRKEVLALLAEARAAEDDEPWLAALARARTLHASTAEREGDIGTLWAWFGAELGPITSVLDLGCGLGPLGLPLTGLPSDIAYVGLDLDVGLCRAVEDALVARWPRLSVRAADVRTAALGGPHDLALALKLAPTLERLERGAAVGLVARVDARAVAVSFPARSLSGRDVGMAEGYEGLAAAVLRGWDVRGPLELRAERVYLGLRRG